jgi:hypothetical protein
MIGAGPEMSRSIAFKTGVRLCQKKVSGTLQQVDDALSDRNPKVPDTFFGQAPAWIGKFQFSCGESTVPEVSSHFSELRRSERAS